MSGETTEKIENDVRKNFRKNLTQKKSCGILF
jgi:hypothetical protein